MKWALKILMSGFVLLGACSEDSDVSETIFDVPSDFRVYVNEFFVIARDKGLELDQNNLIVQFESNLEDGGDPICGTSSGVLTSENQNIILIDPECLAWRYSERSKEILMFHELGHIYLERVHEDEIFPSGDYKTIMFGGNWTVTRFYTEDQFKREYYLNELFNPLEPRPEWAD